MGFRGRYKNKRDANEPEIVDAFQDMGCTVDRIDQPVDLIVGHRGRSYLVEVKQEGKDLNKNQAAWAKNWRGCLAVVRSVDDVRECLREWSIPTREAEK